MIKHVKLGQILNIEDDPEFCKKGRTSREYKVIGIYPFHVVGINSTGIRRSFSYGHLIQMGYEKQNPIFEAIKARNIFISEGTNNEGCDEKQ